MTTDGFLGVDPEAWGFIAACAFTFLVYLLFGLAKMAARRMPHPTPRSAAPAQSLTTVPVRAREFTPEALRAYTCRHCRKARVYRFGDWCDACIDRFLGNDPAGGAS